MKPWLFYVYTGMAIVFALAAFIPFSENRSKEAPDSPDSPPHRKKLLIGAAVALLPILMKMTFAILPLLEARIMPIVIYPVIQKEYWLPFTALFFALVSHLIPKRNRRGVIMAVFLFVCLTAQQTFWRLTEPEIYNNRCVMTDGVCTQSSFDMCGPASMVTMLNAMGIKSREGEMARLAMAAPGRGVTPHQAAYGLKKKLAMAGRDAKTEIRVPDIKDIRSLPTPYIAGTTFSSWTNHMVCILETGPDGLIVGDPSSFGPERWSWEIFEKSWSGVIIVSY